MIDEVKIKQASLSEALLSFLGIGDSELHLPGQMESIHHAPDLCLWMAEKPCDFKR